MYIIYFLQYFFGKTYFNNPRVQLPELSKNKILIIGNHTRKYFCFQLSGKIFVYLLK